VAAATALKAPLSVVVKDYWLTLALASLASSTDFRVVFKGGTSLSKGWGLINRFSEDIDLLVAPVSGAKLGQAASETLLKKVLSTFVRESRFTPSTDPSQTATGGKKPPRRVSYFNYPGSDHAAVDGLLPHLKVELSIHEGNFPTTPRPIRSMLASVILERARTTDTDRYSNLETFDVVCLDPLRTFAEKVSLLAQAFQKGDSVTYCRHYYDLYFLLGEASILERLGTAEHVAIKRSIHRIDQLYEVQQDEAFYATPGTSPAFGFGEPLITELSTAYDGGRIYYGSKPPFAELAARIAIYRSRF